MYEERIRCVSLRNKVMTAEMAATIVQPEMTIGCSGFTTDGFPKAVPLAIAEAGMAKNLTLITPASTGAELDSALEKPGFWRSVFLSSLIRIFERTVQVRRPFRRRAFFRV